MYKRQAPEASQALRVAPLEQFRAIETFKAQKGVKGVVRARDFLAHQTKQGLEVYDTMKGVRSALQITRHNALHGHTMAFYRMANTAATQNNYAAFIAAVTLQHGIKGVTVMETRKTASGERALTVVDAESASYVVPHTEFARFTLALQGQAQSTTSGKPSRYAKALAECERFADVVRTMRETDKAETDKG